MRALRIALPAVSVVRRPLHAGKIPMHVRVLARRPGTGTLAPHIALLRLIHDRPLMLVLFLLDF